MNKPKQDSGGWSKIDWKSIESRTQKLQKQIYQFSLQGNIQKVRKLQHILINRFDSKLLAVRKVTQDNRGKVTPGIDGRKVLSPEERLKLAKDLRITGKATPVKRIMIPKPGTDEKRPLGIPTIQDRACQALVKLALEPEWEAHFEPNSYGFRPGRNCHDAIAQIKISIERSPKYVLDADISKCFDSINHEFLLKKLNLKGKLLQQIKVWLKAGYVAFPNKSIIPTELGTPQGGVISPLLANIALHGLEKYLEEISIEREQFFQTGRKMSPTHKKKALTVVRYADDFVVLHSNKEIIALCQEAISKFLAPIGLTLNNAKTKLSHTLDANLSETGIAGFSFLGFSIIQKHTESRSVKSSTTGKKLGFRTLIFASKKSRIKHIKTLSEKIKTFNDQEALITNLNPVISGWARYFGRATAMEASVMTKMNAILFRKLLVWGKKRTGTTGKGFLKYWHHNGKRWNFGKDPLILCRHSDYVSSINKYVKVKGNASPYNGNENYWKQRLEKSPELSNTKRRLISKQKGICSFCNLQFKPEDIIEIHHKVAKKLGGTNEFNNLVAVHGHCHDRIHGSNAVDHDTMHKENNHNSIE